MRTADQIKRKLHELNARKHAVEAALAGSAAGGSREASQAGTVDLGLAAQLERLEEQILLLEWVLNEPTGRYHG
ncbi:hypothetical protein [Cohnella caldifontis]|uniref:hypothetical protein n=1 Tax=Cohnella caldifontis TaxID=3027471 RepID=UPI0023EC3B14|nr:hypothetical protein [Cohnella sp. YIM B05605]